MDLGRSLNRLRMENRLCDLTLTSGERKLPCHSVVLAARCDKVLQDVQLKESEINLPDECQHGLEDFLLVCYGLEEETALHHRQSSEDTLLRSC